MQRDLLLLIGYFFTLILLIGLVVVYPPTTWTFLSITQFFAIVICGGFISASLIAYVLSWRFTNSIIPAHLRYEPIDTDNFLEILLEDGLNIEPSVRMGQNRLSRIEISQIDTIIKRRLKQELRQNLHKITYNTLTSWLILFFIVNVIFFFTIILIYWTSAGL